MNLPAWFIVSFMLFSLVHAEDVEQFLKAKSFSIKFGSAHTYLPRGTILMISSSEIDNWFNMLGAGLGEYQDWFICDGRNGTPDLRGRFVVGRDAFNSQSDYSANGKTGGTVNNVIDVENLPPHDHTFSGVTSQNGAHTHQYNDVTYPDGCGHVIMPSAYRGVASGSPNSQGCQWSRTTAQSASHDHSFAGKTNLGAGASKPIENRPPYLVVTYIVYKGTN